MSNPNQPPPTGPPYGYPPPTFNFNQKRGLGCGIWGLIILGVLFLIGLVTVVLFIVGIQLY